MSVVLTQRLDAYVQNGFVHHPLFIGSVCGDDKIAAANETFSSKQAQARTAFRLEKWDEYIALHEKPYRVPALARCVRAGLSGEMYWRCVARVWVGTENYFQYIRQWRGLWLSEQPGRRAAMNPREQKVFDWINGKIPVWRGTAHRRVKGPLAWTLSEEIAQDFARRSRGRPVVLRGVVKKADILALFLTRQERELICKDVRVLSSYPLEVRV